MSPTPNAPLTDDELGAALGQSVRGRVDAVPTITPSFDGVERRARQITNRRRGAAGLAIGALAVFGGLGAAAVFDDDDGAIENDVVTEPDTPTDEPAPADPDSSADDAGETDDPAIEPELPTDDEPVDGSGSDTADTPPVDPPEVDGSTEWLDPELLGIRDIESDVDIRDVGPLATTLVGRDENDVVWVATPTGDGETALGDLWQADGVTEVRYVVDPEDPTNRNFVFDMGERIVHVNGEDQARVIADGAYLVGADVVGGRPTAFVADLPEVAGGTEQVGDLTMIDLETGDATVLVDAAIQFDEVDVEEVVVVDDVIFVEGGRIFIWWNFYDAAGNPLDLSSPTDAEDGPSFESDSLYTATLSADGTTLYWLEIFGADPSTLQPTAALHAMDITTGAESAPVSFTLPATEIFLTYDLTAVDDQLLLSRSFHAGGGFRDLQNAAPLLLDPATGALTELDMPAANWKPVAG